MWVAVFVVVFEVAVVGVVVMEVVVLTVLLRTEGERQRR